MVDEAKRVATTFTSPSNARLKSDENPARTRETKARITGFSPLFHRLVVVSDNMHRGLFRTSSTAVDAYVEAVNIIVSHHDSP